MFGSFGRRPYEECHYILYEIISNLDQYYRRCCRFKYLLSRALVAILVGRVESFKHFQKSQNYRS